MRRFPILLAVVTLCTACGSTTPVVERGHDVLLPSETRLVTGVVPASTTLTEMLRDQGVEPPVVDQIVASARTVFDPRRLQSTHPFSLTWTIAGVLQAFDYEIDNVSLLRITPADDGATLRAELLPIPRTLEPATVSATIDAETPSLFAAMNAAGERPELAMAMADILSGQVDFNTELQPEDSFTVAFERFHREGRSNAYGVITALELHNDGRVLRAVRFTPNGGKPGYYDDQGRSVQRFMLRSPLKFEPRVTSGFSMRRMHPVLHTARAHRGVDYGAPEGAPVVAVAAGMVVSATFDATNGRMVRLRHASGYESYYLHLSAFADGIRAGARVTQGQTIGLVGSTGLATGPHLHYGLTRGGVFVNPLREQRSMSPGEPLGAADMESFRIERDRELAALR